jgi:glycosyltransferase involved in cell wall biosynthesis
MHLAIGLLTLFPGRSGGTETYARALVRELGRDAPPDGQITLLVSEQVREALGATGVPTHRVRTYRPGRSAPARLAAMSSALLVPAVAAADVPPGIDAVHYPVTIPVPQVPDAASVVSLNDMQHHELPEFFSRPERIFRRFAYDRAAGRADEVLTLSEHARGQIVERLGITPERVTAIHCAVDHDLFGPEPDEHDAALPALPNRVVLYPANLWPHKNHARLLSAFARAGLGDVGLVLTGQTYGRPLPGPTARVHHLGHVPFVQLPALYRRATATIFPSLFEGFGMPLVEAMASGTPVAASDRGAIAEVAGDAALAFAPTDAEAIADALRRIVIDDALRSRLREAGLARAATFRWDEVARRHTEVYRRATKRRAA